MAPHSLVPVSPSGHHFPITSGDFAAIVCEVGGTLRSLTHRGQDLIRGFGADEVPLGCRGQLLAPWPNRIRDGRYSFGGDDQQLALTEPERGNAIHGLVRHVPWQLAEHTRDRVVQTVRLFPQPGWPGVLDLSVAYRVDANGLSVDLTARNVGSSSLPFGYAAHPYLTAGEDRVDELEVTVPASRCLAVDDRLLPVAEVAVSGPADLRTPIRIGTRSLDTAYHFPLRGDDGRWRVEVRRGERRTELWAEAGLDWVQIFTGDPYRTWGLAVEPMTCGPDAFNPGPTQADLAVLEPGDQRTYRWGITGS